MMVMRLSKEKLRKLLCWIASATALVFACAPLAKCQSTGGRIRGRFGVSRERFRKDTDGREETCMKSAVIRWT